jgi:hypothetical protein
VVTNVSEKTVTCLQCRLFLLGYEIVPYNWLATNLLEEMVALIFRMKDFCAIPVYSLATDCHCSGGNCCLHIQGRRLLLGYGTSLEGGDPEDGGSSSSEMVTTHHPAQCHN